MEEGADSNVEGEARGEGAGGVMGVSYSLGTCLFTIFATFVF